MTDFDVFKLAVQYHIKYNLPASLPHLENERIVDVTGKPYEEGGRENDYSFGALFVVNGDTLPKKLKEDKIILDNQNPQFYDINTDYDFFNYLMENKDKDGAFIVDSKHKKIARVRQLNNSPRNFVHDDVKLATLIPKNFISLKNNNTHDIEEHIGTKTWLAMMLPRAYSPYTKAVQIKRTPYTFGLGLVTEFNNGGLLNDFYFDYKDNEIIGIHRKYEKYNQRIEKVLEEIVYREKVQDLAQSY